MSPTDKISEYIGSFDDWRGDKLKELRPIVNETSADLKESFKWSVPVRTHSRLIMSLADPDFI